MRRRSKVPAAAMLALGLVLLSHSLPAALVLHYNFDDTTNLTSTVDAGTAPPANGNFILNAGRTNQVPGTAGSALNLDVSGNSYVTAGNPAKLNNLTNLTITFWINLRSWLTPSADRLVDKSISATPGTGGFGLRSTANGRQLTFGINSASAAGPLSLDYPVTNEWFFTAVTYDGTRTNQNIQWFLGSRTSVTVGTAAATHAGWAGGPLPNSTANLRIGGTDASTGDRTPAAWMDDVRVYDAVLSPAEIEAIRREVSNLPELSEGGIPESAFLKTNSLMDPSLLVFKPELLLDPTAYNGDASTGLQVAIDAIAKAPLSKGGVIFIKPGNYTLTKTVKIAGDGIVLVGVRDVLGPGTWGPYPTFHYGDTLTDPDYNPNATNPALQLPAVIRVNGNTNYSTAGSFSYNGLHGFNIVCGAGGSSTGAIATALTLHLAHLSMFRDLTITNAASGVSIVDCTTPSLHNISILGVRGDFGIRCGDPNSDAVKVQGLKITAAPDNTAATLALIPGNTEFVGAELSGGRVGIEINGISSTSRAGDVFIRSVHIEDVAEQGVKIGYASQVYVTDLEVERAGQEAIRITTNFYGGLTIANVRARESGLSAIRVQRGLNISIVNAELLDSGQNKAAAAASDLPIAGLSVDASVTSLNLVGARIGSLGATNEDWGVYVRTNAPAPAPWHPPVIIAQNINWLLPPAQRAFGIVIGPGNHDQLLAAGYFVPPAGDAWTNQNQSLPTDPVLPGWLAPAKGCNIYDLPELRDRMWIDLSSTAFSPPIITNGGYLDAAVFANLINEVATNSRFADGVVLYLPAGRFYDSSFTSYSRKIYQLDHPLVINRPNIQLLGDGRDVTQITCTPFAETNDHALKLLGGSQGSGIYGLSVYHDKANLLRTNWVANTDFKAPFRLEGTGNIRLAGTGVRYSMGGGYSILNTTNATLYDCLPLSLGFNNTKPAAELAAFRIEGSTTAGATADIRLYQCLGNVYPNIWMPDQNRFCGWNADGTANSSDVNSSACYIPTDTIPNLDWVRLIGGVQRTRIDYCTFLQGKNGLVTVASGNLVPHDVSTFKFATDHNYDAGMWLQQLTNGDFVGNWAAGRRIGVRLESGVSGDIRYFNQPFRGCGLEGLLIRGGDRVALVNCQVGANSQLWPGVASEGRPFGGIFFGNPSGRNVVVGGLSGWLFNADYFSAHVNPGDQDWGIVLGTMTPTNFTALYGVDLYGNGGTTARNPAFPAGFRRGMGRQLNNGTSAAWLTEGPNYNAVSAGGLPWTWLQQFGLPTDGSADFADSDGDQMNTWQEYRAATNPTNALSKLAIVSIASVTSPNPGTMIAWQSASGVSYTVESSTNLLNGFDGVVRANVAATPPVNSVTDTNTGSLRFYRVRAQ